MEEKKNNAKGVIIGLLIGILLCVIGFCIYLLVNKSNEVKNNEKTEKKVEEKNEELDINSELVQELSNFKIGDNYCYGFFPIYMKEFVEQGYVDYSKMSEYDKINLMALNEKYLFDENQKRYIENLNIDKNAFDEKYKKIYESNINYEKFNRPFLQNTEDLYMYQDSSYIVTGSRAAVTVYSKNTNSLVHYVAGNCGSDMGNRIVTKINNAVKKNYNVEIYIKEIYLDNGNSGTNVYDLYDTFVYEGNTNAKLIAKNVKEEDIEKYFDQGKQYKYTFRYIKSADIYWLDRIDILIVE